MGLPYIIIETKELEHTKIVEGEEVVDYLINIEDRPKNLDSSEVAIHLDASISDNLMEVLNTAIGKGTATLYTQKQAQNKTKSSLWVDASEVIHR